MYAVLFKNNRELDDAHLVEYARQAGLDTAAFAAAMASHTYAPRVQEDVGSGIQSGVGGTPTFFINGVRHDGGYDVETLLALIERASRTLHAADGRHEREAASPAGPDIEVTNDELAQRWEARIDEAVCLIQYDRQGNRILYLHTEVPPALEGRGIASALARAALEDARARNLTVVPLCPFVSAYIQRHPEYLPLVDHAYRVRLRSAPK
jgi:predicted GNAT family acetyltransferase